MTTFTTIEAVLADVREFAIAAGGEAANVSHVLAWSGDAEHGQIVGIADETDVEKMLDAVPEGTWLISFSYDDFSVEKRFTRQYRLTGGVWSVGNYHPRTLREVTHPG